MKNSSQTKSPVMAVVCSVIGHNYTVTNKITNHISEYKCSCCNREVTDTDKGFLTDLTLKQKEINRILYSFVQRRRNKVATQVQISA